MFIRYVAVVLTACLAAAAATPAVANALCQPRLLASLPLTYHGGRPIVTVQVAGHDLHMLVDTGAGDSAITQATYAALNLTGTASTVGSYGQGFGGYAQVNSMVIEDVKLGDSTMHDKVLYVVNLFGRAGEAGVDGVLGYDFLQSFDIGFDLPSNRLDFYEQQDCNQPVLPWQGSFDVEPFVAVHDHTVSPDIGVQLDGKPLTLTIDSGSGRTLLLQPMLRQAGITPKATAPVVTEAGAFGGLSFTIQRQQFGTFDIGAEEFSDVWMETTARPAFDGSQNVAGVVGADYLAHHQVYLDNGNGTAYLGATVAPPK